MKKQVTHISVHQTSKVLALFQTFISFIFIALPVFIYDMIHHLYGLGLTELIVVPLLYLVFTYIVMTIALLCYNFIVKYTGGIEVQITELNDTIAK